MGASNCRPLTTHANGQVPCGHVSAAAASRRWFNAVSRGDSRELRYLLEHGGLGQVDCTDGRGWTALMIAADLGHAACLDLLLACKCSIDLCDGRGWNAVTHAAAGGQECCLRTLIDAGAETQAQDFLGTTPLMRAAIGGHVSCLAALLESGIDNKAACRQTDNLGYSALDHARAKGHAACTHLLTRGLDNGTMLSKEAPVRHKKKSRQVAHRPKLLQPEGWMTGPAAAGPALLTNRYHGKVSRRCQLEQVVEPEWATLIEPF
eukprot:TRINITY_DN111794_c0_g1_i1.p1 TRINITY_DN111794_c0_g1~~TRINITY_DN111794_c0_g1_i1.p1  ORF type:complete len:263 (-),score=21.19 TRINITY_DN111794_c0_g1_i1:49-837(-)